MGALGLRPLGYCYVLRLSGLAILWGMVALSRLGCCGVSRFINRLYLAITRIIAKQAGWLTWELWDAGDYTTPQPLFNLRFEKNSSRA